jgi:hypothetical protein
MFEKSNYQHPSVQEKLKRNINRSQNEFDWKKNNKEKVQ